MRVGRRISKGKELPIDMFEGVFVDGPYEIRVRVHGKIIVCLVPDGHSCLKPW